MPEPDAALAATVALTDAGREVLAGRLDRVACGLDRWLGGVHLKDGGTIWRWNHAQQQMTLRTSENPKPLENPVRTPRGPREPIP